MKQLEFDFMGNKFGLDPKSKNSTNETKIPDFDYWYAENSAERRDYGETPYPKRKALMVYKHLVKTGFFKKGG